MLVVGRLQTLQEMLLPVDVMSESLCNATSEVSLHGRAQRRRPARPKKKPSSRTCRPATQTARYELVTN